MLRSLKELEHFKLRATDGEIGSVINFLFDDDRWTVRYLVAETSMFFNRREVLISPMSFGMVDWKSKRFELSLTRAKIENSPDVDTEKPVSRQHEQDYARYYGYPTYWGYTGLWGMGGWPGALSAGKFEETATHPADVHLRSAREVRGYEIQGIDDEIGRIDDLIVDDQLWAIRYLVIDTSAGWFGKKVLVAPTWANKISWEEHKVYVGLTRAAIKASPEWDPSAPVNRAYETQLHDFHKRPAYWGGPAPLPHAGAKPPLPSTPRL